MTTARQIAAIAALLLLLGCGMPAPPPAALACTVTEDGFAPKRLVERGIGGTGAPIVLADRGIGGTGAKTGVQGTITGFASICVNGLELAYDPADPVDIDGTARRAADLRIGQVVTLRADQNERGWVARAIAVRHAVSGPIEAVGNGGLDLLVAGQTVRLGAKSAGAAGLQTGQWVEVSGLRDPAGAILAARVDARPPGNVFITGRIIGSPGARRIGGAVVRGNLPQGTGNEAVSLVGAYRAGVLTVQQSFAATRPLPRGQVGLVVVEAITQATISANGRQALQIGDDMIAAIGPDFGAIPPDSILTVLVLEQSASGELTALSHHEGRQDGGSPATAIAAALTGLAPHLATTTAGAASAAKAGGTAAQAKAEAASGAAGAKGGTGSGTAGTGGAGNSGPGGGSTGGHGSASPAIK